MHSFLSQVPGLVNTFGSYFKKFLLWLRVVRVSLLGVRSFSREWSELDCFTFAPPKVWWSWKHIYVKSLSFPNLFFLIYVRWFFVALHRCYTSVFTPISRNCDFQIWLVCYECKQIFQEWGGKGRELTFWSTLSTIFLLGRHYHPYIAEEKTEDQRLSTCPVLLSGLTGIQIQVAWC